MANATSRIQLGGVGFDGRRFHVPVDGGSTIYEGTFVAQLIATGMLVPFSTAGAGPAIGKATHDVDASAVGDGVKRCLIETDRDYLVTNGTAGNAFSEADPLGIPVYGPDNQTASKTNVSGTLQQLGTFQGFTPDSKVIVRVSPEHSRAGGLMIQAGRGTFAAGVLTVNAGITVTATSRVFASRVTEAGTDGDEIRVPDADRTVGGPGTGALVFRAFLSGVAATSDTSTFDYLIVG